MVVGKMNERLRNSTTAVQLVVESYANLFAPATTILWLPNHRQFVRSEEDGFCFGTLMESVIKVFCNASAERRVQQTKIVEASMQQSASIIFGLDQGGEKESTMGFRFWPFSMQYGPDHVIHFKYNQVNDKSLYEMEKRLPVSRYTESWCGRFSTLIWWSCWLYHVWKIPWQSEYFWLEISIPE